MPSEPGRGLPPLPDVPFSDAPPRPPASGPAQEAPSRQAAVRNAGLELATSAAWTLVLATAGGWYLGSRVDRWLGTAPVVMALGVVLGSVGGFIYILRLARRLDR